MGHPLAYEEGGLILTQYARDRPQILSVCSLTHLVYKRRAPPGQAQQWIFRPIERKSGYVVGRSEIELSLERLMAGKGKPRAFPTLLRVAAYLGLWHSLLAVVLANRSTEVRRRV
jgi:hypothetical protein